jgi:cellulose synthase/poly-beta-1,6-N-acetylglucosamine synthase-like glycosyltransferase
LLEVGGIATETVTEDAHTALKLHRRGYTTAYLRQVLAGGLATESLSGHIGQRIRWARGMAQIFRLDNPLTGRGLRLLQRLCYSNAMLHFFSGVPVLPISHHQCGRRLDRTVCRAAFGAVELGELPSARTLPALLLERSL